MIIKSYVGEGRIRKVKTMAKPINILVFGMILIALLASSVVWRMTGQAVSEEIVSMAATGAAISEGELEGLELSVIVPEKYQKVQAGEMLQFEISLKNLQKTGRHDIQLDYYIKKNEIVITHRRELKAVETQASFLSSIKVPEETPSGIYTIEVIINEKEEVSTNFNVKSSEMAQIKMYILILTVIIVIVGGLVLWEIHHLVKVENRLLKKTFTN